MRKRWTEEEKLELIRLKEQGKPLVLPDRSESSVKTMIRELIKEGRVSNCHAHYKKWTEEDLAKLDHLRELGTPIKVIAKELDRTFKSVTKKLSTRNHVTIKQEYTDEELLELVIRYRTQDNLNHHRMPGEPSSGPIVRRFGSWGQALQAAGLGANKSGVDYSRPTTLYLVKFEKFFKVGITQRAVQERLTGFPAYTILDTVVFDDLYDALATEREILGKLGQFRVLGTLPNGNYECFNYNCTRLDELI